MIVFRRLGGGELIALNPDLIERVEATPDTVVTMLDEKKFLVHESLEEVLNLITDYRAYVIARSNDLSMSNDGGRPTLHVVPNELITSRENTEEGVDGVDLEFEPDPDGRVHLEFGRERSEQIPDLDGELFEHENSRNEGSSSTFGFGFGGRN